MQLCCSTLAFLACIGFRIPMRCNCCTSSSSFDIRRRDHSSISTSVVRMEPGAGTCSLSAVCRCWGSQEPSGNACPLAVLIGIATGAVPGLESRQKEGDACTVGEFGGQSRHSHDIYPVDRGVVDRGGRRRDGYGSVGWRSSHVDRGNPGFARLMQESKSFYRTQHWSSNGSGKASNGFGDLVRRREEVEEKWGRGGGLIGGRHRSFIRADTSLGKTRGARRMILRRCMNSLQSCHVR